MLLLASLAKSRAIEPTAAWTVAFGIQVTHKNTFSFKSNEVNETDKNVAIIRITKAAQMDAKPKPNEL